MAAALAHHLAHLRPAHRRGLALRVSGTILAQSACQPAVIAALLAHGRDHAPRRRRRERLCDGDDKAAPCRTEVAVEHGYAPLLGWILSWWRGASRPWPSTRPRAATGSWPRWSACSTAAAPSRWPGPSCPATRRGRGSARSCARCAGRRWGRTRRADPRRVARHWLILAVATLRTLAQGTRAEDAERAGVAPARLRTPWRGSRASSMSAPAAASLTSA